MSIITLVLDTCFSFLGQCFDFLSMIEVAPGISLFNIVLALIVFSTVMFGLISVVRIGSAGAVKSYKRSVENSYESYKANRHRKESYNQRYNNGE